MALDPALVGRAYDGVVYEVGRERLAEFATAVGETDPIYHDRTAALTAGHREQVAPFTFPTVIMNVSDRRLHEDATLGIDWARVVDGEEEIAYARPIYAGDVLRAVPRIVAVRSRGALDFLTFRTDVVEAATGAPVCAVTATLIARGGAGA